MSQSAFEIDDEVDFESMWADSIAAAESQEKDMQYEGTQEEDSYSPPPQEAYQEPVREEAPAEEEEEVGFDSDNDIDIDSYDSAPAVEEEDAFDYEKILEGDDEEEEAEPVVEQEYDPEPVAEEVAPTPTPAPAPPAPAPKVEQTYQPEPVVEVQEEPEEDEVLAHEESEFDSQASGAAVKKTGIDYNVSLETLEASFEVLDAYRSLETDEREFAAVFVGLDRESSEPEVVSTVMNAAPLLFEVFEALEHSYLLDDTEIAFYIVGLDTSVIEGISFVASEYLQTDTADSSQKKIPYAREVVAQVKNLDDKAMRLIKAAHSLIKGEVRSEDDLLSS